MRRGAIKNILITAIVISMVLGNSSVLVCAAESGAPHATIVSTPEEYAEAVGSVEAENTEPITIDTATGEVVTESGEETSLEEVFDISAEEAKELTSDSAEANLESIEEYLDDEGIYDIRENGDSELEVSFPYAFRQVMVLISEGALKDAHGATSIVYNRMINQYILEYETEAETRDAYDLLIEEYGKDKVIVNLPVSTLGYSQVKTSYTSASSYSWGNDFMQLDALRDKFNEEKKQNKVVVAVLDSGINTSKELFQGRTISEYSTAYVDATKGDYAYYDDIPATNPNHSHGTHVAGIVADGTSDNVELMIIKVLGSDGKGAVSNIFNAVLYATDNGADIINLSLGINLYDSTPAATEIMDQYIRYAEEHGVVVIAAAGNEAESMDTLRPYPACSPYAHAVTAMKYTTKTGVTFDSSYSNYGSYTDYSAPGTSIYSAYVGSAREHFAMTGTSMAAPHIAAAFAMGKVMKPEATPAELTEFINTFTEDYGTKGKDEYYGYGPVVFSTDKLNLGGSGGQTEIDKPEKPVDPDEPDNPVEPGVEPEQPDIPGEDNPEQPGTQEPGAPETNEPEQRVDEPEKPITLKKTSCKISSRGKKYLTVKWAKVTAKINTRRIAGYQVQIAKNAKFTSGKKLYTVSGYDKGSKKITGLKRHTKYYVRVRTYMTVGNKKIYSPWSAYRSAKTR